MRLDLVERKSDGDLVLQLMLRDRRIEPFHLLVPVAAVAALLLSLRPVVDPDVYWHVRLGGDILRRHSVHGAGSGWSILPPAHPWVSPEWASDLLLHAMHAAFGWRGMLVFEGVAGAAFLVALAAALLPGRDARTAAIAFAMTTVALASYLQARPQTISLVILVWLAVQTRNVITEGRLPRFRWFLPIIFVWAQFHGLWVLGPAFLAFALIVRLLDDRSPSELALLRRGVLLVVAGLAIGCVNPLGINSLLLPFRLHSATATIAEWHATTFVPYFTWGVLGLLAMLVTGWAGHTRTVPRAEVAFVAGVFVFGLLAYRNVAVATVLLAPLAADRPLADRREARVGEREARVLWAVAIAIAAAALLVGVTAAATVQPIPTAAPVSLARMLDDGATHRVLDDYNTGGLMLAFGGPHLRVAVDGRADYYGGPFLKRYMDLMNATGDWRRLLAQLDPDAAVIGTKTPLCSWLLRNGWHESARHGVYSLLFRDTANA